jgi:predicted ABC-type sugar transport system permease subunit
MGREITRAFGIMDGKRMIAESMKTLEKLGLRIKDSRAMVEQLSGGQRQGVAIARVLYFKAKLAAKAMGINTDRIKIACFMLVAAAVIGGTALSGGIGSIAGVFWGAMAISLIENGLVMMRIPYWWTFTVFGGIIIFSVVISKIIEARRLGAGG